MRRLLTFLTAVLIGFSLSVTLADAEDDGFYGDYGISRDVSTGYFLALVRDGSNSQNHCSVIMDNDTANLRKYAAYLRVKNPDDWLSWSGSQVVQAGDSVTWAVSSPASAVNDTREPFIRVSTYVWNSNTHAYDFTGYVTLDLYDPAPGSGIINFGTLGSHTGGNWIYC